MVGKAVVGGRGRKKALPKITIESKDPATPHLHKDFALLMDMPPPNNLNEIGAKMWRVILKQLASQQVLYTTDIVTLENFCIAYQNRIIAQEGIDKYGLYITTPTGNLAKNPAFTVLNENLRHLTVFADKLGLDPHSRQRVIAIVDKGEDNPFLEL